jgi:TRAP-type mannitol/chloroaromatic compound transport system permease small subunit
MKNETKILGTIFFLLASHLIWIYYVASYERKIVHGKIIELTDSNFICQRVEK